MKQSADIRDVERRIEKAMRDFIGIKLSVALTEFQEALYLTPVYTGKTLVNFQWTLGSPATSVRSAIADPALPGVTSDLALGREPRRTANQRVMNAEFFGVRAAIQANPYQDIYLVNLVPNFTDIEYGTYRNGARTPPTGITRSGEAKLRAVIQGITVGP